jgi:GNAT superfamily N-acetyltransferase
MTEAIADLRHRELADSDWDAVASLINQYQTDGITADILRQRNSHWNDRDPRLRLVVEDGAGNLIAYCRSLRRESDPAELFRSSIFVEKQATGKGIGRKLLQVVSSFAKDNGGIALLASVEESCDRGMRFAELAGFQRVQRLFESKLDLTKLDTEIYSAARQRLVDEGITFTTLQQLGDTTENWRNLYELDRETDRDAPGAENWSVGTFEEYYQDLSEDHGFTPECAQLALLNDRLIGVNVVTASTTPGEWHTDYTGVRRELRGKGIALALKVLGAQYAKNNGARILVTNNEERNAPMLAVNKKLGFVEQPGFFVMKKAL